tara:strand:+ start:1161 stop:1697 length:537 start_codon:yes stop_codon:yes gene_type:complete
MNKLEGVSRFQTYSDLTRIGGSSYDGKVYRISDTEVAKVPHIPERVGHEMMIAKRLHEGGVSVAEPRAWDYVSVPEISDDPVKAFIMEYVEGNIGFNLSDLERFGLSIRLRDAEIEKAVALGFEPMEERFLGNYLLTPNDEVKLIDFAQWRHPDVPNFAGVDPETVFEKADYVSGGGR